MTLALAAAIVPGAVVVTAQPDPVPFSQADFSAYATSTVAHADALRQGEVHLADVEVAFTGATADSNGLGTAVNNEVQRQVQPADGSKNAWARGSAVEAGLQRAPGEDNQIILAGKATQAAPPSDAKANSTSIGPFEFDPALWASLLRGEATARWLEDTCILGADMSHGNAYAADVELLDGGGDDADDGSLDSPLLALDAPDPERAVSNSVSRTRLVPQTDEDGDKIGDALGVMAETRQTIAPVTIRLPGSLGGSVITIEFLGEWVLRAVVTGIPGQGGAWVHYGPGEVDPQSHILRIINDGVTQQEITFQQLLQNPAGLVVPIPGVGEIAIGEDPRAIGGNADSSPTEEADGTEASAAVDVVRIHIEAAGLADVRVGHMEVEAVAPEGGISCPIPVTKVPNPGEVLVDEDFVTDITIRNVFDCELTNVTANDVISVEEEARYEVNGVSDGGTYTGSDTAGQVNWALQDPIPAMGNKTLSVNFTATDGPGRILDIVTVQADCGLETADGEATVNVDVSGSADTDVLVGREVLPERKERVLGRQVPARTGLADGPYMLGGVGLLLLALAAGVLAFRRRHA